MTTYNILQRSIRLLIIAAIVAFAGIAFFFYQSPFAHAADGDSSNIDVKDTNTNGKPDQITFDIANSSTNTWTLDGSAPHSLSVTQDGNDITISSVSISNASADPVTIQVDLDESDTDLVVDTDGVNTKAVELVYSQKTGDQSCTGCIKDGTDDELNAISSGDTDATDTEADEMKPIITAITPAEDATDVSQTTDITLTFSEGMNTTFAEGTEFTVSNDEGSYTSSWSDSNTKVTISGPDYALTNTYTVTTDEAEIDADSGSTTALSTSGTEDGDWSFTIESGSTPDEPTPEKTYSVDVTAPNADTQEVAPGDTLVVKWDTGGTGSISFVNLAYAVDGGAYTTIAKNENSDGSYDWTVPSDAVGEVTVRIEATDLVNVMATDVSEAFTVVEETTTPADDATDEADETDTSDETTEEDTSDDGMGTSPVTGEEEAVTDVSPGDYIKSPSFSTVYYVDANMVRHPFLTDETFFTWEDSFDVVKAVTDATLPTLDMGSPMLPKAGVVLVKVQSDARVYALESTGDILSPALREIDSETVAEALYGESWTDYVVDVPPTSFPRFASGKLVDAEGDIPVDIGGMKTRDMLN